MTALPARVRDRSRNVFAGLVAFVVVIALWELIGTLGLLGRSIPPISVVLETIVNQAPLYTRSAGATIGAAASGGAIGYGIGAIIATVATVLPWSETILLRVVVVINSIPIIALGPILMTVGDRSSIPYIFAGLAVLFTTSLTVTAGYAAVDRSSLAMMRSFGASKPMIMTRLRLPSALPGFADALRVGIPAAILGAVLGEWFGADGGLGVLMVSAMRNVQYPLLWGAALLSVIVSFVAYALANALESGLTARFGREQSLSAGDVADSIYQRRAGRLVPLFLAVVIVAAWAAWIALADIRPIVAPGPLAVLQKLVDEWAEFAAAAGVTVAIAFGGMLLGGLIGTALAVVVSLSGQLRRYISPLAVVIPTIPIVVFIPVLGGIFGYGIGTIVASCVLMAFFPFFTLALSGLAAWPPSSKDLFSVYRAGRISTTLRLSLPSAVPSLLLACQLAAANCFLTALTAEWLMGQGGLGRLLSERRAILDNAGSWAAIVIAVVLAVATYSLVTALKRRLGSSWS